MTDLARLLNRATRTQQIQRFADAHPEIVSECAAVYAMAREEFDHGVAHLCELIPAPEATTESSSQAPEPCVVS